MLRRAGALSPAIARLALRALTVALALLALLTTTPALAEPLAPPTASASTPPPTPEAPDSPRASIRRFLDLCKAGEHAEAADYLDLPDARKPEGAALARRLKIVLDRQGTPKLDDVSPLPLGKPNDKLAAGVEEIGIIPTPNGPEPVRLVRRAGPDGMRWIVSRSTVDRIDLWYGQLRDHWIQDLLPAPLLRTGPKDLLWWQWIALPILFGAALGVGRLMGFATHRTLARLTARTRTRWDDLLVARQGAPINLFWAVLVVQLATPWLGLDPPAEAFLGRVVQAGVFLAIFWIVFRGIDVARERALEIPTTRDNPAARSLIPLGAKASKLVVAALAVITVLSQLGYPVTSLVTGLGIGGIALALAAQKTVENLFGSLSIGVDQPFRVGDFINVDTIQGTVESIGLRSTRIRTLDRTVVTLPNGKLADMRIESYAERDRIRFTCTLKLDRATRPDQLRQILDQSRAHFTDHPRIFPDITVVLARLNEYSLDIEIDVWFATRTWSEFATLREASLLHLLDLVEKAGATLANPTRTIHVEPTAQSPLPFTTPAAPPASPKQI